MRNKGGAIIEAGSKNCFYFFFRLFFSLCIVCTLCLCFVFTARSSSGAGDGEGVGVVGTVG